MFIRREICQTFEDAVEMHCCDVNSPNGFNLTPHSISFPAAGALIFPRRLVNSPWPWTCIYSQPLHGNRDEAQLSRTTLIVWKTCLQFLPFKQTVHDMKWDWISVCSLPRLCINTACKLQENNLVTFERVCRPKNAFDRCTNNLKPILCGFWP